MEFEIRQTVRDAHCRNCDKTIKRNTEKVVYIYSFRNRGQNIFICRDCLNKMHHEMSRENEEELSHE